MKNELILNHEDLFNMLDSLMREPESFWDGFYADRQKKVPFFHNAPDENLVSYFERGLVKPGRVLELGCGPGRNALFLAEQGCEVDAVDLSQEALKWGRERAEEQNLSIHFIHRNLFDLEIERGAYDMVYDSGCFHHLAPHRRITYLELLSKALKPGGHFSLICFMEGGRLGGADISDWEVYRSRSLMGGLGYTEEKLKLIFEELAVVEMRKMKVQEASSAQFGVPDFWTGLFKKH